LLYGTLYAVTSNFQMPRHACHVYDVSQLICRSYSTSTFLQKHMENDLFRNYRSTENYWSIAEKNGFEMLT